MCPAGHVLPPAAGGSARSAAPRDVEDLRRRADGITWTILYGDVWAVDVDIAIEALREHVHATMPDRLRLFEMVYVARWQRLREQGWSRERAVGEGA